MDNGLVCCVSTLHHVGTTVKVERKRPHVTVKNRKHVQAVWGSNARQYIFIPLLIHHYNQWMVGVDVADQ
eukprot:5003183-Ditylum_brightwellii.AAC.1